MITFLSSPKPFVGNACRIQRNAILSWKTVHPYAEIIIYGDGEGVADMCREVGAYHVPDVPCSPSGIPTFNGIVEHATKYAKYDVQCYLNCDIIFLNNVYDAIKDIPLNQYLVTGQRIDLHEGIHLDIAKQGWQAELHDILRAGGADLHPPTGMDYFIFRRGMWKSLLPLVIGRGGYDEALVLYCLRNKIPFINATLSIIAVHQFHDYGHHKGGKIAVMEESEDTRNNRNLHRNHHSRPNSADAPWLIVNGNLTENTIQRSVLRKIEQYFRFNLHLERVSLIFRILWRIISPCGVDKPKLISLDAILKSAIEKR